MLSGLVFGMQTALDSNFRGWASPTVHLGSRPRLLHLSASPVVSRTTTNNDILHSCQDKGGSRDGRGKLGCSGTPPKPCTSLGGARSGRRGPPGGAGMVGQKGGLGAGVGVPGTHQHLFPGDLGYVCGLHKSSSQGAAANVCVGAFLGLPEEPREPCALGHGEHVAISAYWGQVHWATGPTCPVCPYWPQEK